jgi:Tfp pilus assembly protein PilO
VNSISQLVSRLLTRRMLIIIAVVLLGLNLMRLAISHFDARSEEVTSRVALLEQYRMSTRQLAAVRNRVAWLENQAKQLEDYLLTGPSEEKIISDIQIKLQEQIAEAGLAVESLRPSRTSARVRGKEQEDEKGYEEVNINIRLAGTLNQFVRFLSALYSSKTLFQIESFTIKPYRNKELKIFFDYTAYYKLTS